MQVHADWNHYTYTYGDGRPATVAFDVASAVFSDARFGAAARVIFGAPVAQDLLEAALADVDCLLVGRLTYAEKTEFVLQVADRAAFDAAEPKLVEQGATVEHSDGWDYFDTRVCPTEADWRRIQDREALERLDLDGNGELLILHRFYGEADALAAIRQRLADEGFEDVGGQSPDRMALTHSHPVSDISTITVGLQRLCGKLGVVYDGWILPG